MEGIATILYVQSRAEEVREKVRELGWFTRQLRRHPGAGYPSAVSRKVSLRFIYWIRKHCGCFHRSLFRTQLRSQSRVGPRLHRSSSRLGCRRDGEGPGKTDPHVCSDDQDGGRTAEVPQKPESAILYPPSRYVRRQSAKSFSVGVI